MNRDLPPTSSFDPALGKPPFLEGKPPSIQAGVLLVLWLCGMILGSLFSLALSLLFFDGGPTEPDAPYLWVSQPVAACALFLFPALCFSYLKSGSFWGSFRLSAAPGRPLLLRVAALSLIILPSVGILAYFNERMILPEFLSNVTQWMREMEDQSAKLLEIMLQTGSGAALLVNLLVMALCPAFVEELFFRGTLQPLLGEWMRNKGAAIWITAFIFSAIHFQFYGFLPRFLLGAYLGYLLLWSRSLWLPILAHFLHNALSLLADFAARQSGHALENLDPAEHPSFILYAILLATLLTLGLFSLYGKRLPEGNPDSES